ncbi:hypothetical protein L7F22_033587 [Adiantum nelumboides]|nr:hypothetical protein [Adiantum nelumboides]
MANALVANHVEEMPIILNVVDYEHEESVAKNVACDEVSFGLCALDVDNRLTSRTMDFFWCCIGPCFVYDACMVNKKQGIDCIGDDDDWGFDDPAVEMNEEMQPFVDAALGRIWVMREQQSHEVVMNSNEAIHMYGREDGGSDVCAGFYYGLANIKIERNLWDMFTMEVPPFMLKKHNFVVGLGGVLKLKVECKRPQNYENALRIAKDKEWKLKHKQAGVFGNTSMPYGLGSCYGNVNHAPYASSKVKMDFLFVKSEPMPQISSRIVVIGHCVDAINKGVHDVHVDEIEARVPIEEERDMANAFVANHVEEMPIVLNVVDYEHEESVAKNVACDEVSFGLCALDVDNRLTSRTMDVFGVALGHVLLDFMARSMVALVLYDGLCYICGLQQVYDACMVNKKQGIDCIGDDDDWGFDDPAMEMKEEMQPFVDAALGRIWVMREQQSHEVVMNSSEAIHMYGREGGSDVCVCFDYGLANIKIERNLWDIFTMECHIAESQVTLLGHVVSSRGIEADPGKVQALVSLPSP